MFRSKEGSYRPRLFGHPRVVQLLQGSIDGCGLDAFGGK